MEEDEYSDDYQALRSIVEGYDPGRRYLNDNMSIRYFNKNNPAKSLINLTFDVEEFLEMIEFYEPSADEDFVQRLFGSGYYYYEPEEYMQFDTASEEWEEGYVIRTFDDENNERLKEIIKYAPKIIKLNDTESIVEFLSNENLEREVVNITTEYQSYYNDCATDTIKEVIKSELSDILQPFGIIQKTFLTNYYTTAGNLYNLYNRFDVQNLDIKEVIKKVIEGISGNFGNYWDEFYSLGCRNFDKDGFNKSIIIYLDRILEKIEEGMGDEEFDRELVERTFKYIQSLEGDEVEGKTRYLIPTMKTKFFIIDNINFSKGVQITIYNKHNETEVEKRLIKFEDFPTFIENYKLFESKGQKKFFLIK